MAASRFKEDMLRICRIKSMPPGQRRRAYLNYASLRTKNSLDRVVVFGDIALAGFVFFQAGLGFAKDPILMKSAILLLPLVLFAADLFGKALHKWLDSYADEERGVLRGLALHYRHHHEVPYQVNEYSYINTVVASSKALFPAFLTLAVLDPEPHIAASVNLFLLAILNIPETHRQAHLPKPNWFFRILQAARLSLSRRDHYKHHCPPFDDNYAIFNNWSYPITEAIGLWGRLDMLWLRHRRKLTNNWIQDPSSIPASVIEEMHHDLGMVPDEFWYTAVAHPTRITDAVQALMDRAAEVRVVPEIQGLRRRALQGLR